ncbi:MAG TPA: DUF4412 domain-containing protein [Verrucomicrobiae bacterium]|nr:DUF4412 domain-containing protein [Verrucomicrobiae bacterium]
MGKLIAIALPLVAATSAALADLTLDFAIEAGGEKHQTRMSIAGDRLRFDAAQGSTIVLPAEKRVLMLFHGTRTFANFQQDDVLGGLAELAPAPAGGSPKITRTGEKQTVGDFDCEKVVIKEADGAKEELWISPKAPPIALAAGTRGQSLDKLGMGFAQTWKKWFSGDPTLANIPVRSITFDPSGKELQRTTLIAFNTNSVPPETFAPPQGYSQQEMPLFGLPSEGNADDMDAKMRSLDDAIQRLDGELKKLEGRGP